MTGEVKVHAWHPSPCLFQDWLLPMHDDGCCAWHMHATKQTSTEKDVSSQTGKAPKLHTMMPRRGKVPTPNGDLGWNSGSLIKRLPAFDK